MGINEYCRHVCSSWRALEAGSPRVTPTMGCIVSQVSFDGQQPLLPHARVPPLPEQVFSFTTSEKTLFHWNAHRYLFGPSNTEQNKFRFPTGELVLDNERHDLVYKLDSSTKDLSDMSSDCMWMLVLGSSPLHPEINESPLRAVSISCNCSKKSGPPVEFL